MAFHISGFLQQMVSGTKSSESASTESAAAENAGIEVISEVELAYRLTPCPITAITGTNGKTTTTTLTGEIMKTAYSGTA